MSGVAGSLYERTGLTSAAEMAGFVIRSEINYQADRIRRLPGGDELVHYAGITWSLTRQQAAAAAAATSSFVNDTTSTAFSWLINDGLDHAANFFTGFADVLTLGGSQALRQAAGTDYTDYGAWMYSGGQVTGVAAGFSIGHAGSGAAAVGGTVYAGARAYTGTETAVAMGISAYNVTTGQATIADAFAFARPIGHAISLGAKTTERFAFVPDSAVSRLTYRPTSGAVLEEIPGRTSTIIGNYQRDMKHIIAEMGNNKSLDFGPKPGGFNVLNAPDSLYINPVQFWQKYNQPWLDAAISRGDNIVFATNPDMSLLRRLNPATGKFELSGFGREYLHLRKHGLLSQL